MKQNINLIVKVVLLIFLILLAWFVRYQSTISESDVESTPKEIVQIDPTLTAAQQQVQPTTKKSISKSTSKKQKAVKQEYFYATKIFKYFRKRGFSRAATAGIIGNMMIETSGGSLDLKPTIYSKSGNYYGLCQWSKKYYPEAHGLSFKQQLNYLFKTMPHEFKTFGWLYKKGFTLKDFKKMTDAEEAAIAFTKIYERCSPASYEQRRQAALIAYKYFKNS